MFPYSHCHMLSLSPWRLHAIFHFYSCTPSHYPSPPHLLLPLILNPLSSIHLLCLPNSIHNQFLIFHFLLITPVNLSCLSHPPLTFPLLYQDTPLLPCLLTLNLNPPLLLLLDLTIISSPHFHGYMSSPPWHNSLFSTPYLYHALPPTMLNLECPCICVPHSFTP